MWMGSGMAPVMFSGIQHYISQMGMGMAAPSFPPIHNPMQLPRVPLDQSISVSQTPNQTLMCQTPILGAFNYQNQMQNSALLEQYARYIGYHLMQSAPQIWFQAVQHSQTTIPPSNSNGPMSGVANIDDAVSGKMGISYCSFSCFGLTGLSFTPGPRNFLERAEIAGPSSQVAGDEIFHAPEEREFRQFSEKSDVYSFGVFLLELLSGRKQQNHHLWTLIKIWLNGYVIISAHLGCRVDKPSYMFTAWFFGAHVECVP